MLRSPDGWDPRRTGHRCWSRTTRTRASASRATSAATGTSYSCSSGDADRDAPHFPRLHRPDASARGCTLTHPPLPTLASITQLLERHTAFESPALVPEIRVFQARSLVEVWEAAESIAGCPVPSPFWAYAWPAGIAL